MATMPNKAQCLMYKLHRLLLKLTSQKNFGNQQKKHFLYIQEFFLKKNNLNIDYLSNQKCSSLSHGNRIIQYILWIFKYKLPVICGDFLIGIRELS